MRFRPLSMLFGFFSALAALTIGSRPRKNAPPGNERMTVTPVTFGTKYTKEGEAFTPANAGLTHVNHGFAVLTGIGEGEVNVATVAYDYTNGKLHLYDETPKEVAENAEVKKPTALVYAFGY